MTIDFTGQTVIVTGAAHGFGRAISLAFAARGAHVWACDVLAGELDETVALAAGLSGTCRAVVVDIRDRAAVDACVTAAAAATPVDESLARVERQPAQPQAVEAAVAAQAIPQVTPQDQEPAVIARR